MASRSTENLKQELESVLAETKSLSLHLSKVLGMTSDYELIRQLKKIDAELLDVQHNLSLALDMES